MLSFGGASPAPLAYSSSLFLFPHLKILNPNPSSNLLSPNCIPITSSPSTGAVSAAAPPASTVLSKRKRYRKTCPGEAEGIAQEMRFVAMRLRNSQSITDDDGGDSWQPSLDGFLKYLVDSRLVFDTIERIVDESADVSCGQVIGKQACEKLLVGKELEFHKWQGDVQELLKDAREKLNMLGEHWTRYEKNRCLREAAKSFKFSGQIVRLIIL